MKKVESTCLRHLLLAPRRVGLPSRRWFASRMSAARVASSRPTLDVLKPELLTRILLPPGVWMLKQTATSTIIIFIIVVVSAVE